MESNQETKGLKTQEEYLDTLVKIQKENYKALSTIKGWVQVVGVLIILGVIVSLIPLIK